MGLLAVIEAIHVEKAIYVVIILMVIVSFILCIVDGTKANRERRKIKLWIKIMFIVSLILLASISLIRIAIIFGYGFKLMGL